MMAEPRASNLWRITVIAGFLVVFGVCVNTALALSGSGTEPDPWLIQSLEDFNDFAADPNYWAWSTYTRLETDVNLAGRVYERAVIAPDVNDAEDGFQGRYFRGVFDGNDHEISNLNCYSNNRDFIGLFGFVSGPNAEIRDLGLIDPNVEGTCAGSLVAVSAYGVIRSCSVEGGNVSGDSYVGGLVGVNTYGSISNCYSTGDVSGTGNCIGGLVGRNTGTISKCRSRGNVSGSGEVGGLVGQNGTWYPTYVSPGDIDRSYSNGTVTGSEYVGGLVGYNPAGSISKCYSTGNVEGGDWGGGLLGYGGWWHWVISDSYWDTQTSNEPNMCGNSEDPNCDNSYGKTTTQLHQQSTFTNWDFIGVWNIGENQTYPYLRTVPAGDINKDKTVNFLDLSVIAQKWCNEE